MAGRVIDWIDSGGRVGSAGLVCGCPSGRFVWACALPFQTVATINGTGPHFLFVPPGGGVFNVNVGGISIDMCDVATPQQF